MKIPLEKILSLSVLERNWTVVWSSSQEIWEYCSLCCWGDGGIDSGALWQPILELLLMFTVVLEHVYATWNCKGNGFVAINITKVQWGELTRNICEYNLKSLSKLFLACQEQINSCCWYWLLNLVYKPVWPKNCSRKMKLHTVSFALWIQKCSLKCS